MRTTIIFDNFGPYHQARLRACARVCALTAVQVSARSAEYAWKNEAREEGFDMVTLFPQATSDHAAPREVARRMHDVLNDCRPEVVFVPGWSTHPALAALGWCSRHGVPAVMMSDSTPWDEKRVGWKEAIKRRILTLCSAALVAGRSNADYVVQLGLPPDRVFYGYDAVDNAYFRQKADEVRKQGAAIRINNGLPENYFLASARFIKKKNLPRLLQAYARYRALCERHAGERPEGNASPPWSLVLLGDGELRAAICSQIAGLLLQDHVLLPGFKQYRDLPFYYALAGAFIHASTTEQWGLVVNEAMASGLPVLVSDRCGCAYDLVQNGRNGFIFDPLDVEGLARLMDQMSSMTTEARNAMGAKSEAIIAEWSPNRFAEGLELAARKALAGGPFRRRTWLDRLLWQGLLAVPLTPQGWDTAKLLTQLSNNVLGRTSESSDSSSNLKEEPSPSKKMVPNFFIIGAPKSGTTALSEYLKDHPNIFFSPVKEPHFFDLDFSKRLKLNLQTYLSLFSGAEPDRHKAVGEGSTGYLFSKVAVSEILKFNPNSKFIVILRNPVDLVQSWHSEMYFEGVENVADFEQAWNLELGRRHGRNIPSSCWEPRKLFYSEWGKLGEQMERLFSVVHRDRVKVILFDDFVADTQRVYEEVLLFLGVPFDGRNDFQIINENKTPRYPRLQRGVASAANYFRRIRVALGFKLGLGLGVSRTLLFLNSKSYPRKSISPELRAELTDFFHEDVQKLSKLLDRDLSDWGFKIHEPQRMDKGDPSKAS